jgi:hypothetical protein
MDPIEQRFPGHIRQETGKKKSGVRTTSLNEVEHRIIIVWQWWQGPCCCRRGSEPVGNVHAAPSHFDDLTSHTRFLATTRRTVAGLICSDRLDRLLIIILHTLHTKAAINAWHIVQSFFEASINCTARVNLHFQAALEA